ncbi:MAG: tetratricopeptide repeat protein [Planctomycetes bacterium]|nr:tetratricopeptide repeat protein [Planctomycetota bacterium]
MRKGLYEKAIQECLKAVKYNNRYIDAYYNLGTAYFNNKQLDQALEITNLVLSIDPNHRDAYELLNLIYEQKRLTEKR